MRRDWLYRRLPTVLMARRNLSRARARSILAALGIAIGVIAIASLGMFGSAFQRSQVQNFGEIGNDLTVSPSGEDGVNNITERHLQDIRRATGLPQEDIIPIKEEFLEIKHGTNRQQVHVLGVENPSRLYTAREGRVPTRWRRGALVGWVLASQLDIDAGDSITVGDRDYRVLAVLTDEGRISAGSADRGVVIPATRLDEDVYGEVVVRAQSTQEANETAVAIKDALNNRKTRVRVFEPGQIAESINQFFRQLNRFLIGIGAISLLVAGVSILNVMLMSAIERREEIGVLRAVGFEKSDVLRVMLTEAMMLGFLGSLVGLALSFVVGAVINNILLGSPLAFDTQGLQYAALGFAFGILASLVSGLYPAWKAANARPVESLRN